MSIMTSHVLKFVDSPETQKFRYPDSKASLELRELYHFKIFKDCLSQILLHPFLNTLTLFFRQIKKINTQYMKAYNMAKKVVF